MPEIITITKRLEFDYGHRVLGHEGKCKNLHGHRGVVEITVSSEKLDKIGRVIDFSMIKERVGWWINECLDHNMILHKDDPILPILIEQKERHPYVLADGSNPTAENLSKELYYIAQHLLVQFGIKVTRVRFYETPTSWSDYESTTS